MLTWARERLSIRPCTGLRRYTVELDWFDRQMEALADFAVTVTFCFTPERRGVAPHHTSPPEFAEFCAAMVRRYAGDGAVPKQSFLSHASVV